ncbi:sugar phosphate isomerase/epimerase [Paenibacillus sp. 19GGS1-52]|uniref:sugar phosphate isomerase/epimerase family protein n=1 Tax=Paenibacillus sp. 19GGS1-52 TaxID=2758563 RepID=UPI001EFAE028|nr:TIM barrel protein [Paenibacillus sp. 19GGS1-52]ULO07304.1 sugar phosphate isomerase/epimerase [Paenibacillus sp. 19GGS1-52]
MSMIYIPASVFGAGVSEQHNLAATVRSSGGDGLEFRRELFPPGELPLIACREAVERERLHSVYSVPIELWKTTGELNEVGLLKALKEAQMLRPEMLKVSLGHFNRECKLEQVERLKQLLEDHRLQAGQFTLLIENDQTPYGGKAENLLFFFEAVTRYGLPGVKLTFDTGNWAYCGEDAFAAAEMLAPYVAYIHCKHVDSSTGTCITLPLPPEKDAPWRKLLKLLPDEVPRAIEFTLPPGERLNYYVNLLRERGEILCT